MYVCVKSALLLLLHLSLLGSLLAQEEEREGSCGPDSTGGGLLGFTALSPDQLRAELREGVRESMAKLLEDLREERSGEEEGYLAAVGVVERGLEKLNSSLAQLQESLVLAVQDSMERHVRSLLTEAVTNLTRTFRDMLSTLNTTPSTPTTPSSPSLPPLPPLPPGLSPSNPARSCVEVLQSLPTAPSGHYWLNARGGGASVSAYCHMTRRCGNLTGGWMRVAHINMSDPSHHCPGNFVEVDMVSSSPPGGGRSRPLCVPNSADSGCFSHTFPVVGGASGYSKVCGRVLAYQDKTPNGFFPFHINPSLTIDDLYLDGVSLTHGSSPRRHVWSFVAGLDETGGHLSACACSNVHSETTALVPPFVGGHYFCDTGSRGEVSFSFYPDDPLWDGRGCGRNSTCCSFNSPPWFFRELGAPTTDGLEMRVCRDGVVSNENLPFEVVELYVR